ncbi:STAS-like domain-containing protein [Patescibacteria group bacterium]|nr:STAS-like domain-containing protein [Patescibacteria group bacterium]
MNIVMKKFGILLNSRPAGREAALRIFQIVNGSIDEKEVILDFAGVEILTPSFADELLYLLKDKYKAIKEIKVKNTETPVVADTISSTTEDAETLINTK